ncbi:UPF0598 protein C8orf82 [Toxocara canis]|uniref:UPF0598 protein C8orf82 n=1 Tax=Toxocara canis TaxID=6265 RepID=A0A0B2UHX8_TOXCA|nr:UPF0598 protein C8orf82 [Toxocara canis]
MYTETLRVLRKPLFISIAATQSRCLAYKQGQTVGRVREYFYYIDHQGQLFLEDARIKNFTSCFKEERFLKFYFSRLTVNKSGRYANEFPYVSPCGIELNFLRCDDRPFVFTALDVDKECWFVGNCSKEVPFEAKNLCMFPNGRLYHPSPLDGYGLVKSKLADQLYPNFIFNSSGLPTHFRWKGETVELNNLLLKYAP